MATNKRTRTGRGDNGARGQELRRQGYHRYFVNTDKARMVIWTDSIPTAKQYVRDQGQHLTMMARTPDYWWQSPDSTDVVLEPATQVA